MAFSDRFNDAILGVKASKKWRANQGQGSNQRSDPSYGHVLSKSAHPTDVLIVMHTHDDRACRQEKQRFEKCMCHQVKNGHGISRDA